MLRLSLRKKLFLVSSLILVIPWLGVRYVQAIEDYLQQVILDNLSAYTQAVATNISSQSSIIPSFPGGESVFASPLRNPPSLDGYDPDWSEYTNPDLLLINNLGNSSNANLKIARHDDSLYFFILINDTDIRYHLSDMALSGPMSSDGIELDLVINGEQKKLGIITEAPGIVYARDLKTSQRYSRIQGEWQQQEQGRGYQVEFKMPISYAASGLNIIVRDNQPGKSLNYSLSDKRMTVLSAPDSVRNMIKQFAMVEGRRLRLLDTDGRMLASAGSLGFARDLKPINPLFAWLLIPDAIADPWNGQTSLMRSDIQSALKGNPMSQRTRLGDGTSMMLSSVWPITEEDEVKAVILIEESTAALQVLQRSALASMLNISLVIFILLAVTLIAFAGRLSNRIRLLETLTDKAIDNQGRVKDNLPQVKQGDELDNLNNHIRAMLIRLKAYHDYLEKLASRLSHEFRTPVAVVRSSLENMQSQLTKTEQDKMTANLERANQGVLRLQTLLHRMAEASRLEQSIHESTSEELNISDFLTQIISGYSDIYQQHHFRFQCEVNTVIASGELLAQALDKLIANAVSFAPQDSEIIISAKYAETKGWVLSVTNQGPFLPEGMESQLFQSMVSIRDKSQKDGQAHLGLGLHIVQLIAEFHRGYASAENHAEGVRINLHMAE